MRSAEVLALALLVCSAQVAQAQQEPQHDVTALAKETQNLVSSLVSVPFQFNFGEGYALGFAPVITANWNASDGNQWTVPIGIGISRTTVFNRRPMTFCRAGLLQPRKA